ncbi:MAG: amidohydrolase family protein [Bacillota bacterium]
MKVIDIHSHFIPECYIASIARAGNVYGETITVENGRKVITVRSGMKYILVDELYRLESIIKEMDDAGIDLAVLSPPPTIFHYNLPADEAKGHAEMLNNGMAEAVATNTARFLGMAYVPLQNGELAAAELERCVKELGIKAVHICTNVEGKNLDDEEFLPFFARAEALQALILVHPWNVAGMDRMRRYHLSNAIGNPMDTAIAVGSLIFGGVLDRYPDLRICFSHAGGAAPFIAGRMDRAYRIRPECRGLTRQAPSEYLKMIYFDTIAHWQPALKYLVDVAGCEQVLLGSDFPFQLFDMGDPDPLATVKQLPDLTEECREKILGRNAARLLGLA